MKKYFAVAKLNFKYTTWISYMIAAFCGVAMVVDMILDRVLNNTGDSTVSVYSMLYLVPLMAPIFIASVNYVKIMNLGVKKKTYFYGCIINYATFAAVISLISVIETYTLDNYLNKSGSTVYGLVRVFGWDSNIFTAFFSQFAFILLLESVVHTLTFMQTKWYGWVADVLIIAIISVFTPISALRKAESFFFYMIIYSNPFVQISVCLVLAILVYMTNLYYLKKRI